MGGHLLVDLDDCLPARHSNEAQSCWAQPQADEAPPERGHYVILPLGEGRGQDLNLSPVETDAFVEPAHVLALGFGVREENLCRTGLENHVSTRGIDDVRHALAHEHDCRVLLPERPEPALDRGAEERMECGDPGLLDDQKRWSPGLQPLLHSMKEVEEDRDEV